MATSMTIFVIFTNCTVLCSKEDVFNELTTCITFLYFTMKQLPIWSSHEIVIQTMPAGFKANYHVTYMIIDGPQLFMEILSTFRAQSQIYSS